MDHPTPPALRLVPIPPESYRRYRREVILQGCKWDPQVGDTNTIADHVVILAREEAQRLCQWAEALAAECDALHAALIRRPDLFTALALAPALGRAIRHQAACRLSPHAVRLLRFDFHPTTAAGGRAWALSEVNADVPGGFAEASWLPRAAAQRVPAGAAWGDVGGELSRALVQHLRPGAHIAMVHATSYADDRQVMHYLAGRLAEEGCSTDLLAPDHLRWRPWGAQSHLDGRSFDAVVRFFPAEWLPRLPRRSAWPDFFSPKLPAANHATAVLLQSKRLPLLWDALGVAVPTWRALLPATCDPAQLPERGRDPGWLLKPTWGRVGQDITLPGTFSHGDARRIRWHQRLFPRAWVAQRAFVSRALSLANGHKVHLCVGVFTVNGRAAGFFGRLSRFPRIDERAQDVPVLVDAASLPPSSLPRGTGS